MKYTFILKWSDVFEYKRFRFNIKWLNYNWLFKENAISFVFKYFQKTEPSQTSKMESFVKIVNGLMSIIIFTKNSILDFWLGSKNANKSFNKSLCEFNFFIFSSHLVKYLSLLLYEFLFLPIFKNDLQVLL